MLSSNAVSMHHFAQLEEFGHKVKNSDLRHKKLFVSELNLIVVIIPDLNVK